MTRFSLKDVRLLFAFSISAAGRRRVAWSQQPKKHVRSSVSDGGSVDINAIDEVLMAQDNILEKTKQTDSRMNQLSHKDIQVYSLIRQFTTTKNELR